MLVVPAEPVRDSKDTADLIDQLDGYKGSFAACAANLDQVAAWKASVEASNENETQANN
ncbi:hypothetical protein HDIA_2008 [Hartmannibacter diazotrophicus]|uniref:Uncharacterized protein n=2 Tax=Hartmannibacter diazotrophicus TaxID=1482074 RepID=A0A2C9D5V9_9HYPH|nr:hypothetical protein [Hartmannibacter diazotrophicus]SON55549.1 hypothetical protein HDIA_2008 [Hartmannibacter diazotrophicus]